MIYERDLLYLRLPTLNLKLGPIYVYYYIPQLKITTVIFSSILIEKTNSIQVAFYASLQSHKEKSLIASSEFEAMYYDKINPLGQVA